MSEEDRLEAESALEAGRVEPAGDPTLSVCPHCHKQTKVEDPHVEILCSHCWKPIPALSGGAEAGKRPSGTRLISATGAGGFYAELAGSVFYPIGALSSLLTASGVAFLAALVPVAVMTLAANVMELENVGTEQGVQKADLSGVQLILIGIFTLEIVFFSAVAIHAFLDVVRATGTGDDRPPKLSFSPNQWLKSLVSYLILCAYFGLMTWLVARITIEVDFTDFVAGGRIKELLQTGGTPFAVGMVLISALIPMHLLGVSLGNITQALNPANVIKSVAATHVHYVFLVLLLSVYGGLFSFAFAAILFDWFIPKINVMFSSSSEGRIIDVAYPLLAWGLVMAFFFYGAYILARLHGLFVRSFRKHLLFGTR
ncbi:MAG: hypothetical protein ACE5EC_05335, partial [Phycisphaerae bacterium]